MYRRPRRSRALKWWVGRPQGAANEEDLLEAFKVMDADSGGTIDKVGPRGLACAHWTVCGNARV